MLTITLMHCLNPFVDRILMRTGKCSKYQFTGIWMTHINVHFITSLVYIDDLIYIFNLQFRIDSLGEHIISNI